MIGPVAENERQRVKAHVAGRADFGWHGSALEHERYMIPTRSRRRCRKCPGYGMQRPRETHAGMCNGVTLTSGCEWHVRQWVRGTP